MDMAFRHCSISLKLGPSIFLLAVLVSLVFSLPAFCRQITAKEKIDKHILTGLDYFFNFEFEVGEKEFNKVIEFAPDNPAGYLFKAVGLMAQPLSLYKNKTPDLADSEEVLEELLQKAVRKGETAIRGATQDSNMYFMLAIAYALRSFRALDGNSPLKSLREAKTGHSYLLEGLQLDPQNYDFYYGLGILNYYLGNIKGLYGFLVSRIFFKGDKARGISELEKAAEKGLYAKFSAKAELFFILINMEKDFNKAIPLGYELLDKYPNNPEFNFLQTYSLSEVKRWPEALNLAEKIQEKIEKGKGSYWEVLAPRHWHLLGKIYLDQGELEKARDYLEKAAAVKEKEFLWIQSLAFARLGMIYDLKQQREKAMEFYEHALQAYENGAGAALAKRYLESPYTR